MRLFWALGLAMTAGLQAQTRPSLPRDRDTNDWIAYYQRGLDIGRRSADQARPYFTTAARLDPTNSTPLVALYLDGLLGKPVAIQTDDGMGHTIRDSIWPLAEDLLDQALLLTPDLTVFAMTEYLSRRRLTNAPRQFFRGLALVDAREWAESVRELSAALERDSSDTRPLFWRGLAYARLELWREAHADYQRLIVDYPCGTAARSAYRPGIFLPALTGSRLYYVLAYFALRASDTTEAKALLNRAVDCDGRFSLSYSLLGNLALVRGDTLQALTQYQLAVDRRPEDAYLRFGLGTILLALRRPDSARVHLAAAVRLNPDFAQAHFHLGEAEEALGRRDEAAAAYRAFLARAPRRLTALIRQAEAALRRFSPSPEE